MNSQKEATARETQVAKQMGNLNARLAELEEGIANMKNRLVSVLRDDTIADSEKAAKDPEALVPLAYDIKALTDRVNALNNDISIMLRDLEL